MVDLLFKNSVNRFLYEALLAGSGDEQALRGYIEGNIDDYYNRFQPTTTNRMSRSIFAREVYTQLHAIQMASQKPLEEPVNLHQQIGVLKGYGLARQAYIKDATVWLTRHATVETDRLEKAWQHRSEARLQGSQDSVGEILETWQLSEEARLGLPKLSVYDRAISTDEIKARYGDWIDQLRPFYSEEASIEIIRSCAIETADSALFPSVTLSLGNKGQYIGEILAKDDPHGATIGCETNCCMRV